MYSLGTPETDRYKNKVKQGHVTMDGSGIPRSGKVIDTCIALGSDKEG